MTDIPTFDGREVDAARMSFSGSVDDSEKVLGVDDEVTLVVKGRVTGVAHKTNQFGVLRRVHSVAVDHAIDADDEVAARLAAEIKRRHDEEVGQGSLDDEIDGADDDDEGEGEA